MSRVVYLDGYRKPGAPTHDQHNEIYGQYQRSKQRNERHDQRDSPAPNTDQCAFKNRHKSACDKDLGPYSKDIKTVVKLNLTLRAAIHVAIYVATQEGF